MSAFVPPYPPRLPAAPPAWRRLMLGRQNFLAMWEEGAFSLEFDSTWLLMRRAFLCNSPASVQFALSVKNGSFERKAPQMRHALEPLLGDGLFVSDGETWRKRRRIVAPVVHVSRMEEFARLMIEAAEETAARWADRAGGEIDALSESAQLTAEIICRTIFGRELGQHYAHEIVDSFSNYQRRIGQIDLLSLLGLPDWVPRWHDRTIHRAVRRIHRVLETIITSYRRGDHSGDQAVIGRLLDALAPVEARNEAAVLFMAGHETTANSLAWTWYLLSQASDVEARLHAELDTVLGGRPPALGDLPALAYTRAVFAEAMRLYPPVPILAREALVEESFDGQRIPKGSLVFVVPWLLHRHRKLWADPDHFVPERFLPGRVETIDKFSYIPFSTGPRVCAGLSFAQTEAILCLATLAQRFRLRLKQGARVEPVCRLALRPEGGLPMTIEPRHQKAGRTSAPAPQTAGCPVHHG